MLGENPDTHVVMLTAEGRGDVVEACLAAGAKGYIRKDLPPDELKTHFNALLKGEP